MENIPKWFEEQKEQNPDWENILDKIIEGISDRGFDSADLNQFVEQGLGKIKTDYEAEFIQDLDDEAQGDTN